MTEPSSMHRLTAALDAWFAWKERPSGSVDEFLAAHEDLRDLLEPLVVEGAPAADGDAEGDAADPAPREFGDFRIVREIGRGGMGIVYEAVQRSLGRRVALKVLASPFGAGAHGVARFRRESELLARLSHPNIVPVYAAGLVDGVPFHAMERVDGCTLAAVLAAVVEAGDRRDGAGLARAQRALLGDDAAGETLAATDHVTSCVRLVLAVARALAAAHERGIVHRDVKPANVLLRRDGTPLLTDFGLARDVADARMTRTGEFAGTPHYVSPEQAAGDAARVDGRTDVFSLAVVLYESLLLQRPFDGDSTEAVLERIRKTDPAGLRGRRSGLPKDLVAVLDKALQKLPDDRYATMTAFARDLDAVLARQPVSVRASGVLLRTWRSLRRQPLRAALLLAVGVGGPLVLGLSLYLWWQRPRIAAAARSERMPMVERLLERMLMYQDLDDDDGARERAAATAAYELLPDLPEAVAAMAVVEMRHRTGAAGPYLARLRELAPDVADQLERADAPEPESALAWFVRGMRRIETGHRTGEQQAYRDAELMLRRAIARADLPRSLYHCQRLHALLHLRDVAAIRDAVADTRLLWPDSPFAWSWRGFASSDSDREVAERELRRAGELAPDLPQPPVRLGRLAENDDRPQEAYEHFRRANEIAPDFLAARFGLARTLATLGRRDEGLAMARETAQHHPYSYMAHTNLARALGRAGRRDEAFVAYEAAIAAGPAAAAPHVMRSMTYMDYGNHPEALNDAEAACALEPTNSSAWSVRASALVHLGRPAEAVPWFERLLGRHPDDAEGWCHLAQARRRAEDLQGADAAIETARRLAPDHADAWVELGRIRRAQGRREEAAASFQRVIELVPGDGEARINLAGLCIEDGALEQALDLLTQARTNRPDLPSWEPSFRVLTRLGRPREALDLRAKYCELRPRDRRARLDLVRAALALPVAAGDAELLARAFGELAAIDGGSRTDVEQLRAAAAERMKR